MFWTNHLPIHSFIFTFSFEFGEPMKEATVFHHLSKENQFLILSTYFCCYYYCRTFSCIFFKCLFFFTKHIKVMLKVFKLMLTINVEWNLCSHHTIKNCETEREAIRYDESMASVAVFSSHHLSKSVTWQQPFKNEAWFASWLISKRAYLNSWKSQS